MVGGWKQLYSSSPPPTNRLLFNSLLIAIPIIVKVMDVYSWNKEFYCYCFTVISLWFCRPTSFLDLSSSQLKLLRRRARKRLRTMKLPITRAGRKMARQDSGLPCQFYQLVTSYMNWVAIIEIKHIKIINLLFWVFIIIIKKTIELAIWFISVLHSWHEQWNIEDEKLTYLLHGNLHKYSIQPEAMRVRIVNLRDQNTA